MAEVFLGSLMLVPFNFAPTGFALCQGQIMQISQNTALFSLIGTFYGGNGTSNFALPDLRGRVPISSGQGLGLSQYDLGQTGGEESVTLIQPQMPVHNHSFNATIVPRGGTVGTAAGNVMGQGTQNVYSDNGPSNAPFAGAALGAAGNSQPHENRMPTLTMSWIIALQGIFPPRS